EQVASYLQNKKQGFILVSHDRRFVDEVVDHVLSIEKSQLILYQGNFSVYEEQKKRRDSYEQEQNIKLKKEIGRLKQSSEEKAEWSRGRERDKYGKDRKSTRLNSSHVSISYAVFCLKKKKTKKKKA